MDIFRKTEEESVRRDTLSPSAVRRGRAAFINSPPLPCAK